MYKNILILNVFIMCSFFSCGKKTAASNEAFVWLDKNFSNQFDIIMSDYAVNTWTSLDRNKFWIMLTLKSDPEIQLSIPWNSDLEAGGATVEAIRTKVENAKDDVDKARKLIAAFKENGIQKLSIGVTEANKGYFVDVLFYTNPLPEERLKWFEVVQNTVSKWNLSPETHFWFCFMEEDYYGKDFKEIVPKRFIHEWLDGKRDNSIITLETDWHTNMSYSKINSQFTINLNSHRALTEYGKAALDFAAEWSKSKIKHAIYLRESGMTSQINDKDPMAIDYCIPFFLNKQDSDAESEYNERIAGYVCGTYQVDQKTFKNVKTKKEL